VVQRHNDQMPLFARYQVESYLAGMFNPTVQLKSGGYIVIGVTEALVAIDVNSGRATKEGSIEDTALKTNLEAAEEIARQLRLRDLAGLIVIDFIDMEERRNNLAVEKRIKDKLKTDRARIQIGRISGFGLLEMSRQRLRPGMLESTTQPCAHCHGTGLIRSDDSLGLQVLRALEDEGARKRSKEVLLKAPIGIVNFLFNQKREHLAVIEARYGMAVRIEADPMMISPDFLLEKFKTATRVVPDAAAVISGNASLMGAPVLEEEDDDIVEEDIDDETDDAEDEGEGESTAATNGRSADPANPGKKKRRRRRKKKGGAGAGQGEQGESVDQDGSEPAAVASDAEGAGSTEAAPAADAEAKKAPRRSRSRSSKAVETVAETPVVEVVVEAVTEPAAEPLAEVAAPVAKRPASRRKVAVEAPAEGVEPAPKPARTRTPRGKAAVAAEAFPADPGVTEPAVADVKPVLRADPEDVAAQTAPAAPAAEPEDPNKPKRKGWWSLGR
jgi:ribonuclease E